MDKRFHEMTDGELDHTINPIQDEDVLDLRDAVALANGVDRYLTRLEMGGLDVADARRQVREHRQQAQGMLAAIEPMKPTPDERSYDPSLTFKAPQTELE